MLLADPPRTQYDLYFSLFGIPVRVHPMFWLVGAVLGIGNVGDQHFLLFVWLAVFFVSILVHEMGHALTMRYFGWNPSVTLYAMGGFARYDGGFTANVSSYQRRGNRGYAQVLIAAAGPGAGFSLAALVVMVACLLGADVKFRSPLNWEITLANYGPWCRAVIHWALYVNIFWGLMNLLPVYPLDGGQISRELLMKYSARDGVQHSLWLSVITGAVLAVYSFRSLPFLAMIFAYLAYSNYQLLQSYRGAGFRRHPW